MKEGVHFAHLQVEFKVVWPFQAASVISLYRMNYSSSYTDIMLYKETTEAA